MNQFTTDIVDALVKKQDITDVFRLHLEKAVNTLHASELTTFLYRYFRLRQEVTS